MNKKKGRKKRRENSLPKYVELRERPRTQQTDRDFGLDSVSAPDILREIAVSYF